MHPVVLVGERTARLALTKMSPDRLLDLSHDTCFQEGRDQRHAPISTQYRRLGTHPSRPAARFSKTPPQFSMTVTEPTFSSSQVTSTRSRPIDDATARDWPRMAVA